MADKVDVLGYGGQAGGGKTDLALGLGATKFYNTLFFRRTFPQLRKVIKRGDQIFPNRFIEGSKKIWRMGEREITLASMQYASNWEDYQGWDSDLIAFDEAAQFLEIQVRSLFGWLRTTRPNQHTLMLLCFNPPTSADGEWIVQFFAPWIDPDYPGERALAGEIRYFIPDGDGFIEVDSPTPFERNGETVRPHSRTFIPASRYDNSYLGEDYERSLDLLPEPLRTQVKGGDFTVGGEDDPWQVIPTNWVLAAQERGRNGQRPTLKLRAMGVDVAHGGADKTAISKLYGNWFDEIVTYQGQETEKGENVAQLIMNAMESPCLVGIDPIGYGSSATEFLEKRHNQVLKINAGEGTTSTDASGKYGFKNVRAEYHWMLREALNPENGHDIALPDDRELRVDLCAARYKVVGSDYQIEAKEDIKKRLGRSPDKGESVMFAWYAANKPVLPMSGNIPRNTNGNHPVRRGRY